MTSTPINTNRHSLSSLVFMATMAIILLASCTKPWHPRHNQIPSYTSEVLDKWITMQLRLIRNATGIPNHGFSRHYVYAGITAFESLAPGLPAHASWRGNWNGLTGLPSAQHTDCYYYPANVNGAMAAINKALFPNASATDKMAIDSLEAALIESFLTKQPQTLITTSSEFGKGVAAAVYNWAESDGYKNAGNAYSPPVGAGLWVPTAPGFANAVTPYWGKNRPAITGSIDDTQPVAPIAYSVQPGSPFYQMVKQVYDVSQVLTDDQKAMAIFWRDVPGATSPGHWLSILQQVIRQNKTQPDKAALAYALTGAAINDGLISCFQTKYAVNLVRPITYIRDVMGQTSWNAYLTTPAHPEYSSAHAVLSAAAAAIFKDLFGNIGSFTDYTYDYLNFAPRTYSSFKEIGEEASQSRFYAGIHYQQSVDAGIMQGRKVAANILSSKQYSSKN